MILAVLIFGSADGVPNAVLYVEVPVSVKKSLKKELLIKYFMGIFCLKFDIVSGEVDIDITNFVIK